MSLDVLVGVVHLRKDALSGLHVGAGLTGLDRLAELARGGCLRAAEAVEAAEDYHAGVVGDDWRPDRVFVRHQRNLGRAIITAAGVLEARFVALLSLEIGVVSFVE